MVSGAGLALAGLGIAALRWAAVAGGRFPGDYAGLSATPTRVAGAWTVSSMPPNPAAASYQILYAATLRS